MSFLNVAGKFDFRRWKSSAGLYLSGKLVHLESTVDSVKPNDSQDAAKEYSRLSACRELLLGVIFDPYAVLVKISLDVVFCYFDVAIYESRFEEEKAAQNGIDSATQDKNCSQT